MSERIRPRRGEVWDVDFDPVRGHEQGGRRPALVVSNDRLNASPSRLCMVLPITSRNRRIPAHLEIAPPEGGVRSRSFILCDQLRTVSTERFVRRRGMATSENVADTIKMVTRFMGPIPD